MTVPKTLVEKLSETVDSLNPDKIFIVTDSVVDGLTLGFLPEYERIVFPAGEENKSLDSIVKIWDRLSENGATRRTLLLNLGGGMVSDLGGFAAATFKRGINYANIPTTLLAAVDAAIGGKTGINFRGYKNEIGAFRMPLFTIPLIESFSTLPDSEMLSGYGEMLKTGLLIGDNAFAEMCNPDFLDIDKPSFKKYVEECAAFKQKIVTADPTEQGLRKILNLGHTFGHAFESLMIRRSTPVAHGIAVAHGILAALILSRMLLDMERETLYRYADVLKNVFPKLSLNCDDAETLMDMMGHDKKNLTAGRPRFVLLERPGEAVYDVEPSREDILSAYEIYRDMIL